MVVCFVVLGWRNLMLMAWLLYQKLLNIMYFMGFHENSFAISTHNEVLMCILFPGLWTGLWTGWSWTQLYSRAYELASFPGLSVSGLVAYSFVLRVRVQSPESRFCTYPLLVQSRVQDPGFAPIQVVWVLHCRISLYKNPQNRTTIHIMIYSNFTRWHCYSPLSPSLAFRSTALGSTWRQSPLMLLWTTMLHCPVGWCHPQVSTL